MQNTVRSAKKFSEFASNDVLAKALINQFKDMSWPKEFRSLGAKIGELDREIVGWWAKRPEEAKCLAQLLDVSLSDLGLHGQPGDHFFRFSEFPELPPLDLKKENSWVLAKPQPDPNQVIKQLGPGDLDHWLRDTPRVVHPPYNMDWLHVQDSLELQLLSRKLDAASPYEVLFVETLADAGDRLLSTKPLIVSVSVDGGEEDLTELARRPQDVGTLVIAPFMQSVREETSSAESMSWERITSRGHERDRFDLTAPGPFGNLKRWTWTLLPDWRCRLLEWVGERLSRYGIDTLFSLQHMEDWLNRFDSHAEWFCTAADMMHLCRMGHHNEKKLPKQSDPDAGNLLVESFFRKETFSHSLRIKQLAEARWDRRDLPWNGDLPLETWLSLVRPGTTNASRIELEAIAKGKTLSERENAADRLANLIEAGNPDILLSDGLIKQGRHGYFDFLHRTLAGLVVRDSLMRQIDGESLESWALACFDPARRRVVDAALDVVSMDNLVGATERLKQAASDSAVAISASEALFMAVGRRIVKGEVIPPALMDVAKCVLGRLNIADFFDLPSPWSRPVESQDEQLDWISACWAWSLMPHAPLPMLSTWLFPGWSETLPEPPYWLLALWPDQKCEHVSSACEGFLSVVDQWVKDLERPITDAPRILSIGLLGKAARGAWPADPAWWQDQIGVISVERALLKRFNDAGKEAAARLWPSYLAFERQIPTDKHWLIVWSGVRRWLLEQLKPNDVLDSLDVDGLLYLASVPESLPPALRKPLLQSLAQSSPVEWMDALPFFTRFGSAAAPALVEYLGHDELGGAAATCLWNWDAENAERFLHNREKLNIEARRNLLNACPAIHLAKAVAVLLAEPTLFDALERLLWARKHLPKAGSEAERLIEIMRMS